MLDHQIGWTFDPALLDHVRAFGLHEEEVGLHVVPLIEEDVEGGEEDLAESVALDEGSQYQVKLAGDALVPHPGARRHEQLPANDFVADGAAVGQTRELLVRPALGLGSSLHGISSSRAT